MKDFVFVWIIRTETNSPKLNINTCRFEEICFNKVTTENITLHPITKDFSEIFKELPGLPLHCEVEHAIKLIGILLKPSPIYKLSPLEDQTLQQHLKEALDKGLICTSKFPYGAAIFFFQKKMVLYI